jgi:hypothetical protein
MPAKGDDSAAARASRFIQSGRQVPRPMHDPQDVCDLTVHLKQDQVPLCDQAIDADRQIRATRADSTYSKSYPA